MTQPLRLLPGGVPLEVVRGEPFAVVASFVDAAGDPLPLTGTFAAELLDRDAVPLAGGAMAVDATGAATGVLRVEATAAASALLVDSLHRWRLRDVSSDHTVLDGPVRPRPSGAAGVAAASFEVTAQVAMGEAVVTVSVMTTGSSGGGGGGADLSDAVPAGLGVAAAGVDGEASRADHVHAMPTAGDVGALSASSGYNTAGGWLRLDEDGTIPDNRIPSSIARDSEVAGASGINYPANSILANNTGLSAPASGLSRAQIRSMLAINMEPFRVRTNDYILLSRQTAWGAINTTFSSTASNSNNLASYTPFYVAERIGIDTLSLFCNTANAGAGACIRMGIYADNGGRPGSVVLDAGTAGIGAPGLKSVTFTETFLDPGLYWYVVVAQSLDTGINPTFMGGTTTSTTIGEPAPIASSSMFTFITATVSGALAANPAVAFGRSTVAKVFHVWARVSTPS